MLLNSGILGSCTLSMSYQHPASSFYEALPLGNGSLGAMAYGGISAERFTLNQESVWSSRFRERINPVAKDALPKVRELIFAGDLQAAEQLIYEQLLSPSCEQGHYEPLAELKLCLDRHIPHHSELFSPRAPHCDHYTRSLDLASSTYHCSYEADGIAYEREAFISYPDQVMAVHLTASAPMSLRIELSRWGECDAVQADAEYLRLSGGGGSRPYYCTVLTAVSDGSVTPSGTFLLIDHASELTIYLAARTDFYESDTLSPDEWCLARLRIATAKGYTKVRADHVEDYQSLFGRVSLSLPEDPDTERFYHYARYLLISSGRDHDLPANLQGLWNEDLRPAWGSRYTTNINVQMNYWFAESAALSECHQTLIDHIGRMIPRGKEVAEKLYGCRGAVAFHNTDIYGDCAPNESWMPASIWPMGLAWLGTHLIEHVRYSASKEDAAKALPALEEICRFFIDFLTEDPQGRLITCPSSSPENTYLLPNGQKSTICAGPAMDMQILRELFGGYLELQQEAGAVSSFDAKSSDKSVVSTVLVNDINMLLNRLPQDKIGSHGQLLEWQEEYEEWEKGHRHISHLFGLYPGSQIDPERTPELADAARITLSERLSGGGGQTGWSRSWVICFFARLLDGDSAYEHLHALLREQTAPNLFDLHPALAPGMREVFQIDGNFGAAAGITEMLLQSQNSVIRLLPALPSAWKSGSVTGLRARGGITVSLSWQNGELTECTLTSSIAQEINIEYRGRHVTVPAPENQIITVMI